MRAHPGQGQLSLRARAPGKVNLCLFLGGARASDGRHEVVTLLESVSLADELSLAVLASDEEGDQVVCPGVQGPNLVAGALAGLRARGWAGPPVRIQISKRIPVAGGMGGGSADAACALRLASYLAALSSEFTPLPPDLALGELAACLGADVPSQLAPGLALGTGAGEVVEQIARLAPHALLIAPLDVELSTADVYRAADRLGLPRSPEELRQRRDALASALAPGVRLSAALLVNDLEPAAQAVCPAIPEALAALRSAGAEHAFVCGSGPTCAGLYWGPQAPVRAGAGAAMLTDRFPGAVAVLPVNADFAGVTEAA